MTKAEAAEKVAKLRRLSEKAGTVAEAQSARAKAQALVEKFGLSEEELSLGSQAAAFDELLQELDNVVRRHPVPAQVIDAIKTVRENTKKEDKADALRKFVKYLKLLSMFFGTNKTIQITTSIVDDVIRKHNVSL